jgi:hypothetical protein
MQRILPILIVLSFPLLATAQISKGSFLLGGELYYAESKYKSTYANNAEQNSNGGVFNISFGKAIKENTVFGLILTYSPSWQGTYFDSPDGPLSYNNNSYEIGIFYRKYKSLGKDFFLFGQGEIDYSKSNQSGKDSVGNKPLSGSSSGGNISFMPGISYRISKKVFLELSLPELFFIGYSKYQLTDQLQTTTNDQFSVSTSLNSSPLEELAIGFRLIF